MRNLASVQKVIKVTPIPNADQIETLTVLGWEIVAQKGEYKVDDLVVYCEIDSIMPDRPEFEFLRPRHFRIKTIKLRKQISQGICFPLSILTKPNTDPNIKSIILTDYKEGDDVTEILGVKKYEPDEYNGDSAKLGAKHKSKFPSFISKTNETRVQAIPWVLEEFKNVNFYVAEKLDGSSCTIYLKDGHFGVCSRNLELYSQDNAFWQTVIKFDIENKLRKYCNQTGGKFKQWFRRTFRKNSYMNIGIQAELVGPGVQKNPLNLKELNLFVFNVLKIDEQPGFKHLTLWDMQEFCNKLKLNTVPIVEEMFKLPSTVQDLVTYVTRPSLFNKGNKQYEEYLDPQSNKKSLQEGFVFRPMTPMYHQKLGMVSFKCINPEYLLKHDA